MAALSFSPTVISVSAEQSLLVTVSAPDTITTESLRIALGSAYCPASSTTCTVLSANAVRRRRALSIVERMFNVTRVLAPDDSLAAPVVVASALAFYLGYAPASDLSISSELLGNTAVAVATTALSNLDAFLDVMSTLPGAVATALNLPADAVALLEAPPSSASPPPLSPSPSFPPSPEPSPPPPPMPEQPPSPPDASSMNETSDQKMSAEDDSDDNTLIYVLLAFIIVALLVIFFLLRARRKPKKSFEKFDAIDVHLTKTDETDLGLPTDKREDGISPTGVAALERARSQRAENGGEEEDGGRKVTRTNSWSRMAIRREKPAVVTRDQYEGMDDSDVTVPPTPQ